MTHQSKAKIFLAEERGMHETTDFRSFYTVNFGNYFNEHKGPVEDIYVVNDDTLDGGRSLIMQVKVPSYVMLLPVIGAIASKDSLGNENLIVAGQVQIISAATGLTIDISNPFQEHLVNFMQFWIKAPVMTAVAKPFIADYYINKKLDNLVKISPQKINGLDTPFSVSIGKFNGRGETLHQLDKSNSTAFIFVLEGAFETEGRLLHARDGLALWNTSNIEMEALSNDAIVLLLETGGGG